MKADTIYYFDPGERTVPECAQVLRGMLLEVMSRRRPEGVLILCIGTDRSTGDSLGPLTGHKLKRRCGRFPVVGTLDRPVHAVNLEESLSMIRTRYPEYLVIAVDASVGDPEHVGCVTVGRGALRPGLGVKKELNAVGDIFITGIVGGCGSRDPRMLQSVRLSVVMRMADFISGSISLVERFFARPALL